MHTRISRCSTINSWRNEEEGREVLRKRAAVKVAGNGTLEGLPSIVELTAQLWEGERKGVLYLHDYDLPTMFQRVIANVKMLNRLPGVRWLAIESPGSSSQQKEPSDAMGHRDR